MVVRKGARSRQSLPDKDCLLPERSRKDEITTDLVRRSNDNVTEYETTASPPLASASSICQTVARNA